MAFNKKEKKIPVEELQENFLTGAKRSHVLKRSHSETNAILGMSLNFTIALKRIHLSNTSS